MLSVTHDIAITPQTGTIESACSDSNFIYVVTNQPDYRVYNWNAKQTNTTLSLSSTPTAIALASPASGVIGYSAARISIVDANNNKLDITTNALATCSTSFDQQVAGSPSHNLAISTTSTNGKMCKTDLSAQTVSQLSPTPLSGTQASCVFYKSDTNTWLVGTLTGKVFEMDSTGSQVGSTLTLANTPNVSAPTLYVTAVAFYNGYLLIACYGTIFCYLWPSGVFNWSIPYATETYGFSQTQPATFISTPACGLCLVGQGSQQTPNSTTGVSELFFNLVSGNIPTLTTKYNESVSGAFRGGIQPTVTGLDYSKAWVVFGNAEGTGLQLRLYNISSPYPCSETTRFQNPIGTDVAFRCIRIRDNGIGRTAVELDQNVAAGIVSVACGADQQYIELALYNNIGTMDWDVREFHT